eukprot:5382476-Lingulodinium_polyedra.AAC.1
MRDPLFAIVRRSTRQAAVMLAYADRWVPVLRRVGMPDKDWARLSLPLSDVLSDPARCRQPRSAACDHLKTAGWAPF